MASAHSDNAGPPVWTGSAPGLANGFIDRPETGAVLEGSLVPGATVALVSGIPGGGGRDWRESCGKTQLAVSMAQSLWRAGAVDLVIWLTATTRASVLSGYATAAAVVGSQFSGNADAVTARFLGWLRDTDRPWLVVLDDLTAAVALDDGFPWPAGPAGRVLVTTAEPGSLFGRGAHVVPVGPFSRRESLTYLIGRLTADLDQRQGAIDLVGDLDGEPLALAQASAVIASSELTCHDYREHFAYRRDQAGGVGAVRRLAGRGRDHLVAVGGPRRPAVTGHRSVAPGAHRAARRQRDPQRGPDRQRGPRIRHRRRRRLGGDARECDGLPRAGGPALRQPRARPARRGRRAGLRRRP